jgi:DNA polymerase-1
MPVQGTSADVIKLAMLRMQDRLDALGMESKMLLQIHDELLFEVPQAEAGALASIVQEVMPHVLTLDVPLAVDIKLGRSWGEL